MKRIVHQVGHLQRLYRDARSTEHKILSILISEARQTRPLNHLRFKAPDVEP